METFEYMHIKASLIPEEIMKHYQLVDNIHNGYVYMEISKGMYGFPKAGIIYHTQLKVHLFFLSFVPATVTR